MHVGDRHLPLAVTADVSFLARLPIHSLGHQLTVATGSMLAAHLARHVRSVTKL
jgi:hypothetical protein